MTVGAASHSLPDVPLEILYHVFSHLDPIHQSNEDQAYESRRSLALAASAFSGFTGPALDVLWKRLPDDQPLADLLCTLGIATKEVIHEEIQHLSGNERQRRYRPLYHGGGARTGRNVDAAKAYEKRWRLIRGYDLKYVLRTTDDPRKHPNWPRFMEYASRVRTITLFLFDGPAWSTMWEEILCVTQRAPILPGLLSVAFHYFTRKALNPGAFALISPSVHNFDLSVYSFSKNKPDKALCSIFIQSLTVAPEIRELRLLFRPSCLEPSLLQTYCSQLRHLEVLPLLDLDSLRLLIKLPVLQHLSISLPILQELPQARPTFAFKSITTLIVKGTWANLSSLLNTIHLPSMHTLSITGWEYGGPVAELARAATQCFRTLTSRHPFITSLSVSATNGSVAPPSGCREFERPAVKDALPASLLDLMQPLLALSALHRLELGFPSYFDIVCTETDLRAVAEAYPALEAFHLRLWPYSRFARPDDSPECVVRGGSLDALAHFARSCSRLRVLHLPAMEMTERSLALASEQLGDGQPLPSGEPHGLRTLVIPRVLLPAGRTDLAARLWEVMRGIFPLAAYAFRLERLAVEEDWAVADGDSGCLECARGSSVAFAFSPYVRLYSWHLYLSSA